jgi:hypothetical protein
VGQTVRIEHQVLQAAGKRAAPKTPKARLVGQESTGLI